MSYSRYLIRYLTIAVAVFLPVILWAQPARCDSVTGFFNSTVSGCSGSLFKTLPNDLSLEYLRLIFGSVSTSLQGASNQLVGEMFRIFNLGILIITTSLISYTAFSSVMSSAQEGSSMSQKVSPFLVVRIVGGTSLLLPSFNGYSGIQVMVMYAVVQGVGFANSAWSTALDYIDKTGLSIEQSASLDAYNSQKNILSSTLLLDMSKSAVCLQSYKMQCELTGECQDLPSNSASTNASYFKVDGTFNSQNNSGKIVFGIKTTGNDVKDLCGSYRVSGVNETNSPGANNMIYFTVLNIANSFNAEARSWVMQLHNSINKSTDGKPSEDLYKCVTTNSTSGPNSCPFFSSNLVSAASSYIGIYDIIWIEQNKSKDANTSWTKNAESRGWLTAGMYYRNLITGGNTPNNKDGMVAKGTTWYSPKYFTIDKSPKEEPSGLTSDFLEIYKTYSDNAGRMTAAAYNQVNALQAASASASSLSASYGNTAATTAEPKGTAITFNTISDQITSKMSGMIIEGNYKDVTLAGVGSDSGDNFGMSQNAMKVPLQNMMAVILGMVEQLMGYTILNYPNGVDSSALGCALQDPHKTSNAGCTSGHPTPRCSPSDSNNYCHLPYGLLGGTYFESIGQRTDPILGVTVMGQRMMALAVGYWYQTTTFLYTTIISASMKLFFGSMAIQLPMTAAAAALYGEAPFAASALAATATLATNIMKLYFDIGKIGIEIYVPLGNAIATVVFGLGIVMGVYIPFLPFLLYLFGAIGWIMAVIEAMVAAPLVALGVTHPEGHDLLGKSEQALMLLLGVFVRPITMILGLFFAIELAAIVVKLFNYGFLFVAYNFINQFDMSANSGGNYGLIMQNIGFVGLVLVYAYVLMTILEQVYGLIYQVPDKILRWIGGPQDSAGSVSQMVNQIKSQISSMGQSVGQAGSGTTKGPQVSGQTARGVEWKKDEDNTHGAGSAQGS